jgi:glycerol-3-phosphate dehydrogenase
LASQDWDVAVVGGGIVGAGIMREAAASGLRTLLVERADFAAGSSSRSSKLIHGGLHYLARMDLGLALAASRERDRLLMVGGDLVKPLTFLLPVAEGDIHLNRWKVRFGLGIYRLLAGRSTSSGCLDRDALDRVLPGLHPSIRVAFAYRDAITDDAGLVLRVLREGCNVGGRPVNYMEAVYPLRGPGGVIVGLRIVDHVSGLRADVRARVVINAAGPWADGLRSTLGLRPRMRWIAGSHLVLAGRVAGNQAVVTRHPHTGEPFYVIPWGGRTLVGSTTVEQAEREPPQKRISLEESDYLLAGVRHLFPRAPLGPRRVVSTFTGIRPIVNRGKDDPSRASRDHALWEEDGMLTVAGGKLTTFQRVSREAVAWLRPRFSRISSGSSSSWATPARPESLPPDLPFSAALAARLRDRYGTAALLAMAEGPSDDRRPLGTLPILSGELRWIAAHEAVVHLEDILLRRVRIGLTARQGGARQMDAIRRVVQPALGWNDSQWNDEVAAYRLLWSEEYCPPEPTRVARTKNKRTPLNATA